MLGKLAAIFTALGPIFKVIWGFFSPKERTKRRKKKYDKQLGLLRDKTAEARKNNNEEEYNRLNAEIKEILQTINKLGI